jgi:hypothetical protein
MFCVRTRVTFRDMIRVSVWVRVKTRNTFRVRARVR